jgi:hypothetical protein
MEIAFRGYGSPGEPVDLFDRLMTDLDAIMQVAR